MTQKGKGFMSNFHFHFNQSQYLDRLISHQGGKCRNLSNFGIIGLEVLHDRKYKIMQLYVCVSIFVFIC